MLSHSCVESYNAKNSSETLENFLVMPKAKITEQDKKLVKKSCLKFIIKDIRPMYAVEGDGLTELLSTFTSVGKNYGTLSASQISEFLAHPTTVILNFFSLFVMI